MGNRLEIKEDLMKPLLRASFDCQEKICVDLLCNPLVYRQHDSRSLSLFISSVCDFTLTI